MGLIGNSPNSYETLNSAIGSIPPPIISLGPPRGFLCFWWLDASGNLPRLLNLRDGPRSVVCERRKALAGVSSGITSFAGLLKA